MSDCIFCKIARGELNAAVRYRDEQVLAIEDITPQAPVHLLVLPVRHYTSIDEVAGEPGGALMAMLMATAARLGRERGGAEGFRLVVNTGPQGGQTVDHVHVHVLAGRPMTWPPG